jgi:hypothetical protein
MVGEEGRAQVTAGYRQTTEEANEIHPRFFSPLGVYGLPHINSKQFLAVMRVGNAVLDSFSYSLSILQVSPPLKKLFSVVLFTAGLSLE